MYFNLSSSVVIQQCGFHFPGNTLAAVKIDHRKTDGKIQNGHIRLIGFTVAMAVWGACTNTQSWIFRVWEASVQRVWWLTSWHQLLFCDTAIITSGKNKSFCCFIGRKKPCPASSSAKPESSLSFWAYGGSVDQNEGARRGENPAEVFVMGWSPGTVHSTVTFEIYQGV